MKNIIVVLIFFCVSCAFLRKDSIRQPIDGIYYKQFKDGLNYTLTINPDSTFEYAIKGGYVTHSGSKCSGKWAHFGDTIYLKCFDEEFPAQIASGYMTEREKKAILLKGNRIKIENIILRLIDRR